LQGGEKDTAGWRRAFLLMTMDDRMVSPSTVGAVL